MITLERSGAFTLGCNYWASHAGTRMWRDYWRPAVVGRDLAALGAAGLTTLRVFPLWNDVYGLVGRRFLTPAPGANEGQVASVEGRGYPAHQAKPLVKASLLEFRSRRERCLIPRAAMDNCTFALVRAIHHFQLRR